VEVALPSESATVVNPKNWQAFTAAVRGGNPRRLTADLRHLKGMTGGPQVRRF
jgi:hypothetical protein